MDTWLFMLLLKPFIAVGVLAGLWLIVQFAGVLKRVVKPLFPEGWLKRELFAESPEARRAPNSASSSKSIL